MNIWGHKKAYKKCIEQQNYWELKIDQDGNRARTKAHHYQKKKKWHLKKIKELSG